MFDCYVQNKTERLSRFIFQCQKGVCFAFNNVHQITRGFIKLVEQSRPTLPRVGRYRTTKRFEIAFPVP